MGNCGDCKYWRKPDNRYGEVPGVGKCTRVIQCWHATQWSEDPEVDSRVLRPEYKDCLAFVQDASDYYAELKTFSDFGCVQYEKQNVEVAEEAHRIADGMIEARKQ